MFGIIGKTLRSVSSGLFGSRSNTPIETNHNDNWDLTSNPNKDPELNNISPSIDYLNPNLNKAHTNLSDLELANFDKPINEDLIQKLKTKLQGKTISLIYADSRSEDLINILKQSLRNSRSSLSLNNNLKNQIKLTGLKLCQIEVAKLITQLKSLSSEENFNKNLYKKIFDDYFKSCHHLVQELNVIVVSELIENKDASEKDLMIIIQTLKEAGASIAKEYLNKFADSLIKFIPDEPDENDKQITYKNVFIETYREELRRLTIASRLGLIDDTLPNIILQPTKIPNSLAEEELSKFLSFISHFQEVVQGSVISNPKMDDSIKICHLHKEFSQQILKQYIDSIIQHFECIHDGIPNTQQIREINILEHSKNNLRQFLSTIVTNELKTYKDIADFSEYKVIKELGLPFKDELEIIKNIYNNSLQTLYILGTNIEKLPGYDTETASLHKFLNKDDAKRHFERIILEVNLLAGFDAICTFKGWKKNPEPLINNYKNSQTIPWLKDLYQERLKIFNKLISDEKSEINIAGAVEYISHLGIALKQSTQLFKSQEFFKRCQIEPLAEELLNSMTNLTRIGVMSLTILFLKSHFSTIFNKDDINALASSEEKKDIRDLKLLIEYLEKAARVENAEGELVHAPIESIYTDKTYSKLSKALSDTGFLLNNTNLILRFLKRSISNTLKAREINANYKSRNITLAVWLFYILVKFLPKQSNDAESLLIRKNIFEIMYDDNIRQQRLIPKILLDKLKGHALGTSEEATMSKDQKGIFESLFTDLDSKIDEHAQGKKSNVPLKNLLQIYSDVEKIIKNNPQIDQRVREIFAKHKLHYLDGLDVALSKVIDTDLKLVIDFARQHKDPKTSRALANALLDKAFDLSNNLTPKLTTNNEIVILDSDSNTIKSFTKFLRYLHSLGYLMNLYGDNKLTLNVNNFIGTDENTVIDQTAINTIKNKISQVEKFLNLRVLLKDDENYGSNLEVFPDQYEIKRTLISEIQKFRSLKPAVGLVYEWRTQTNIDKLKAKSIDYSLAM